MSGLIHQTRRIHIPRTILTPTARPRALWLQQAAWHSTKSAPPSYMANSLLVGVPLAITAYGCYDIWEKYSEDQEKNKREEKLSSEKILKHASDEYSPEHFKAWMQRNNIKLSDSVSDGHSNIVELLILEKKWAVLQQLLDKPLAYKVYINEATIKAVRDKHLQPFLAWKLCKLSGSHYMLSTQCPSFLEAEKPIIKCIVRDELKHKVSGICLLYSDFNLLKPKELRDYLALAVRRLGKDDLASVLNDGNIKDKKTLLAALVELRFTPHPGQISYLKKRKPSIEEIADHQAKQTDIEACIAAVLEAGADPNATCDNADTAFDYIPEEVSVFAKTGEVKRVVPRNETRVAQLLRQHDKGISTTSFLTAARLAAKAKQQAQAATDFARSGRTGF